MGALQDEEGRIRCKQQRIYKRFTSMAACSVAPRPSPNEKSRPAAARVVAFMCGGVRHAALMETPGTVGHAGRVTRAAH
jgi:hypothetical protein